MMLDREEVIIDGKEVSDRDSSSHDGVPGEMPHGKSGGDMKPDGL